MSRPSEIVQYMNRLTAMASLTGQKGGPPVRWPVAVSVAAVEVPGARNQFAVDWLDGDYMGFVDYLQFVDTPRAPSALAADAVVLRGIVSVLSELTRMSYGRYAGPLTVVVSSANIKLIVESLVTKPIHLVTDGLDYMRQEILLLSGCIRRLPSLQVRVRVDIRSDR